MYWRPCRVWTPSPPRKSSGQLQFIVECEPTQGPARGIVPPRHRARLGSGRHSHRWVVVRGHLPPADGPASRRRTGAGSRRVRLPMNLRNIQTIWTKEVGTYFGSPIAYVIAAVFVGMTGFSFALSVEGRFPEATVRGFLFGPTGRSSL